MNQQTGDPTSVRDWLKSQREARPHWFKVRATARPTLRECPKPPRLRPRPLGSSPTRSVPQPLARPAKDTTAPAGRLMQEMSEQEFAQYKKQNRHARLVSISNVGGRRTCVVDCGSQATAQQAGGQSLDEYRQLAEDPGPGPHGWCEVMLAGQPCDSDAPPPRGWPRRPQAARRPTRHGRTVAATVTTSCPRNDTKRERHYDADGNEVRTRGVRQVNPTANTLGGAVSLTSE